MGAPAIDASTAVQRWRLRYSRDATAADLSPREEADLWASALGRTHLPLVATRASGPDPDDTRRPRMSFAPPLPRGAEALDEPLELELTERRRIHEVRAAVEAVVPDGHRLGGLHDVWLRGAALPALVRELEYALEVEGVPMGDLREPVDDLLRAASLPAERTRGSRTSQFDLRPLVVAIEVRPAAEPAPRGQSSSAVLVIRGRADPALGVARPADVLTALGDRLGVALEPLRVVRTRVVLADDRPVHSAASVR